VENIRLKACSINWRTCENGSLEYFQWQLDSTDEQCFTQLPFEFIILNPIHEGNQPNLFV